MKNKQHDVSKKINITLPEWQWANLLFLMQKYITQENEATQLSYKDFARRFLSKSTFKESIKEEK